MIARRGENKQVDQRGTEEQMLQLFPRPEPEKVSCAAGKVVADRAAQAQALDVIPYHLDLLWAPYAEAGFVR